MQSPETKTSLEQAETRRGARVRPWFLRLTDASPLSPAWTGGAVTLALLGLAAVLRLGLASERVPVPAFSEQVALQVLFFFCVLPGYLIAATAYQERGVLRDLEDLHGRPLRPGLVSELKPDLSRFPPGKLRLAMLIGLLFHFAMVLGAGRIPLSTLSPMSLFPMFAMALVVAPATYVSLAQASVFRRLGREIPVHLFDQRRHNVYVRVGLRLVLVAAGISAMALATHTDWNRAELPVYVLLTVPLVWTPLSVSLTLLPVWGVHQAIRAEKQRERDRILNAIAGDEAALEASPLAAHAPSLTGVRLLDYLEKVERVREWPFDATVLRRFGLYLLIPPLGWIGGALVERGVDRLLQ